MKELDLGENERKKEKAILTLEMKREGKKKEVKQGQKKRILMNYEQFNMLHSLFYCIFCCIVLNVSFGHHRKRKVRVGILEI